MVSPGRSRDVATSAELGHDCQPDPTDASPKIPRERRHDIEHVVIDEEPYAGYELDQCRHCGTTARRGCVNPHVACPVRAGSETTTNAQTDSMRSTSSTAGTEVSEFSR